jgi:hypothetical protein
VEEFWIVITDGVAHELAQGPYPSAKEAEADAARKGQSSGDGIEVVLYRGRNGIAEHPIKTIGNPTGDEG